MASLHAALEIDLPRAQAASDQVELRLSNPASEAEPAPHRDPSWQSVKVAPRWLYLKRLLPCPPVA